MTENQLLNLQNTTEPQSINAQIKIKVSHALREIRYLTVLNSLFGVKEFNIVVFVLE
jgi:hypothetical protein